MCKNETVNDDAVFKQGIRIRMRARVMKTFGMRARNAVRFKKLAHRTPQTAE